MEITLSCPVKLNLTLRVLSRRPDGYHELYSLFWKKYSDERLTISQNCDEIMGDSLDVSGTEIDGENLVTKALAAARRSFGGIPALKMKLDKIFPAGSGIGAGSGNAAALLSWLADNYALSLSAGEIGKLGADVSFLAQKYEMAEARGIGEILEPVGAALPLCWLLAFPSWSSNTKEAYSALDEMRGRDYAPMTPMEAASEARNCVKTLAGGGRSGLLPNDFYPLLAERHGEYKTAEKIAEESGAAGWGLCGSGSAFFALYADIEAAERAGSERFAREKWIIKTHYLE